MIIAFSFNLFPYLSINSNPPQQPGNLKDIADIEILEVDVLSIRFVVSKIWLLARAWVVCGLVTQARMEARLGITMPEVSV